MTRPTLALVAFAVLLSGTRAVDAGLNFVDHFTDVENGEIGGSNLTPAYGPNSITGPGGQQSAIGALAPVVVGTGSTQMVVVGGTGSLTAPSGYDRHTFSMYRYIKVEMTSDFDVEYNVNVIENNAPTEFQGTSWAGIAFGSPTTNYDLPSASSGSYSQHFGSSSPDFSGTPSSPLVTQFEFAANARSASNGSSLIPFDAPLDFDFEFELKFTPTSYADTNGDGVNDNFGPAFAVPEPSSFLLLSLLGLVGMSGKYFRRDR